MVSSMTASYTFDKLYTAAISRLVNLSNMAGSHSSLIVVMSLMSSCSIVCSLI